MSTHDHGPPERVAKVPWKIQRLPGEDAWEHRVRVAREVMAAAHDDPALGADRSVSVRWVLDVLEEAAQECEPGDAAVLAWAAERIAGTVR